MNVAYKETIKSLSDEQLDKDGTFASKLLNVLFTASSLAKEIMAGNTDRFRDCLWIAECELEGVQEAIWEEELRRTALKEKEPTKEDYDSGYIPDEGIDDDYGPPEPE